MEDKTLAPTKSPSRLISQTPQSPLAKTTDLNGTTDKGIKEEPTSGTTILSIPFLEFMTTETEFTTTTLPGTLVPHTNQLRGPMANGLDQENIRSHRPEKVTQTMLELEDRRIRTLLMLQMQRKMWLMPMCIVTIESFTTN